MPYIKEEERHCVYSNYAGKGPGVLNYLLTTLVDGWLADRGVSYTTINEAIGALECAKLELYRRVATPYEDKKRNDNGEVYTCLGVKP